MLKRSLIGVLVVGMLATVALGDIMTVPGDPRLAGSWEFNTLDPENTALGATVTGSPGYSNSGEAGDPNRSGIHTSGEYATFSDWGNDGNHSYATPVFAGDYSVDMKIVAWQNPNSLSARSGSISHAGLGKGRALAYREGTGNELFIDVRINFNIGTFHLPQTSANQLDMRAVRLVVTDNGNGNALLTCYDLENQTVPGQWDLVGAIELTGASGMYGAAGSMGFGSNSGGATTSMEFKIDYARFSNSVLGAGDAILGTPEPASLSFLVLGTLALLRRRH